MLLHGVVRVGQEAKGKYTVLLYLERVHGKGIEVSGKLGCGLSSGKDFWLVWSKQGHHIHPFFGELPEKAGPDL